MANTAEYILSSWFSPNFPIGGYAYAHGLGAAIDNDVLKTADDLRDYLQFLLYCGSLHNDLILCKLAYEADDVKKINDCAIALAGCASRLKETKELGTAFAKAVISWDCHIADNFTYPIAVANAAKQLSLPCKLLLTYYAQGFISNLVVIGVRHIPLGQGDGQKIMADLTNHVVTLCDNLKNASEHDLYNNSIMADIYAMQYEISGDKIFRS